MTYGEFQKLISSLRECRVELEAEITRYYRFCSKPHAQRREDYEGALTVAKRGVSEAFHALGKFQEDFDRVEAARRAEGEKRREDLS